MLFGSWSRRICSLPTVTKSADTEVSRQLLVFTLGNGDMFRFELPGLVEEILEAVEVDDEVLLFWLMLFTWW